MSFGRSNDLRSTGNKTRNWRRALIAGIACCVGLMAVSVCSAAPVGAGSIPAWLDDAITDWNTANPASPILFTDIKDSYVWYSIEGKPEFSSKDIRGRVYNIAYKHGYANSQDEEIVTTGKPPVASGPAPVRKCWTRSFLRDIQKGSPTTVERMLTTMVCEDGSNWSAGFRILQ
jgi:hypothetical protein